MVTTVTIIDQRGVSVCFSDFDAFLLEGDVFTKDLIETYINYKRENEVNPVNIQPHPHEFKLYYDA